MTLVDTYKEQARETAEQEARERATAWNRYRELLERQAEASPGDVQRLRELAEYLGLDTRLVELHSIVIAEAAQLRRLADALPEHVQTERQARERLAELRAEIKRLNDELVQVHAIGEQTGQAAQKAREAARDLETLAQQFPGPLLGQDLQVPPAIAVRRVSSAIFRKQQQLGIEPRRE